MRKVACALLVLGVGACGGRGGEEAASEASETPSMSAMPSDTTQLPCVGDTCPPAPIVRDTAIPCDTCPGRD
jgi:hypothetical protein